jgi:hypothetical protein
MLITLTDIHGEPTPINPDHIIWVESVGGDRPFRRIHHVRGELQVTETREQIIALCAPQAIEGSLLEVTGPHEFKGDASFVQEASDSPAQTVAAAIESERRGGRVRK